MFTTFIVNGNAANLNTLIEGVTETPDNSFFLIIVNEKCPTANRNYISKICKSMDNLKVQKIKYSKNSFSAYIRSSYMNFLREEDSRIVIIPKMSSTVGKRFINEMERGRIIIRSSFMQDQDPTIDLINRIMDRRAEIYPDVKAGGPLHILIDYENVNNAGLVGSRYLSSDDSVTLFYSGNAATIQSGFFEDFTKKAGSFNMVKLKQIRKNGLDFYIAVKVGEIIRTHPGEKIMIVSHDQGFNAVLDYCELYADSLERICLAPTIESGIVLIDGDTPRKREILESRTVVDLESEYSTFRERRDLYNKISGMLIDTPYPAETQRIIDIITSTCSPRERYTAMLHEYGLKQGVELYRFVKDVTV